MGTLYSKGSTTINYLYGPDDARFYQRKDANGELSETIYIGGGIYEEETVAGVTTLKSYVGDFLIDKRQGETVTQTYTLRDHLGSIDTVVDDDVTDDLQASVIERSFFAPFGERIVDARDGTTLDPVTDDRGFTDHEHMDEVGLIHMNGRVYDPVIGRFLSADPFVQYPHNSQSYNRYSYVLNNPLSFTDPSGYFSFNGTWNPMEWDWSFDQEIEFISGGIKQGVIDWGNSFSEDHLTNLPGGVSYTVDTGLSVDSPVEQAGADYIAPAIIILGVANDVRTADIDDLAGDASKLVDNFVSDLYRMNTPSHNAAGRFEIEQTGLFNYRVPGGGSTIDIDGYQGQTLLEAKFIEKPAVSPYINDSNVPAFLRQKILQEQQYEFQRYKAVLDDPAVPFIRLDVLTNESKAVPYFDSLIRQFDIPGNVKVVNTQIPQIIPKKP